MEKDTGELMVVGVPVVQQTPQFVAFERKLRNRKEEGMIRR